MATRPLQDTLRSEKERRSINACLLLDEHLEAGRGFFIIIWFVRLLVLRPIVPASGDSEDDCGEAD
jgi:hypothetical protein